MKSRPTRSRRLTRRRLLQWGGAVAGASLVSRWSPAFAESGPGQRKFLFVIGAAGGANITDMLLPVADNEPSSTQLADSLIVYPESLIAQPLGSNLRVVRNFNPSPLFTSAYQPEVFLQQHSADAAVITSEVTSVNHVVAQKRAVTGAGIDRGRTIMEAVAERHGADLPLPNVNMGFGGVAEAGDDPTLETRFRGELLSDPTLFAASTDTYRGVVDAPPKSLFDRARSIREQLDDESPFGQTFRHARLRQQWLQARRERVPTLESLDLINKLLLVPQSVGPALGAVGLQNAPELPLLQTHLPRVLSDPFQSQAGLAYLLARYEVSCALTIGTDTTPDLDDGAILETPIGYDFSHTDHLSAQNVMWARILETTDGLIRLLKATPYGDGTLFDRSLVYVSTEFGRSKGRPSGAFGGFGTGHHLSNGALLVSPLLKGNAVYGGVDPETLLTHGMDLQTGAPTAPAPGTAPVEGQVMREGHVYSAIAQALDVDFDGRYDMSAMVK